VGAMPAVDPVWLDFLEFVALRNDRWTFFRGLPCKEFKNVPGVARSDRAPASGWRPDIEQRLFQDFKAMAQTYESGLNFTDLDWLAVAQHFGLPTRLLDWTDNPLVAAWFAVADETVHRPNPPKRTPLPAIVHVIIVDPSALAVDPDRLSERWSLFSCAFRHGRRGLPRSMDCFRCIVICGMSGTWTPTRG